MSEISDQQMSIDGQLVDTCRAASPSAELGRTRASGCGCESGLQGIDDYTRPKAMWVKPPSDPPGSQFVAR